jgi:hypothetical protein
VAHLWIPGQPIRVRSDALGIPVSLRWEKQWHPTDKVYSRWRVDKRWWQQRIWREYFKLTTTTGMLVVVYRDFVNGKWYLQRLYD